jgi:hypothetical protein
MTENWLKENEIFIKILKQTLYGSDELSKFNMYLTLPFKYFYSREMFIMKWSVFNEFCKRLFQFFNVMTTKLVTNEHKGNAAAVIEVYVAYLLWDMGNEYKLSTSLHYNNCDGVTKLDKHL